ncbi:alanyl-tRNA editing protein [Stappia indica]|uniref:Alanine--tRNA ligase n=1 Tax=Stappia indica TaxID=538381 RepID=A0A857CDL7_9HYPH|nr:alanyl-tRNA editing protein [Stappia indica]QGZ36938.1 alanyl-tRNA editing protein [Stappia indica]
MTDLLFRDDAYLRSCDARVTAITDRGGIVLDRTVFYATGGGQPGDSGRIELADGRQIPIATTVYGEDRSQIVHVPAEGETLPAVGDNIVLHLDWDRRYRLMRVHTALHLLSVVLPFPVTGGQIGEGEGRLDFDLPEGSPDKDEVAAKVNEIAAADHAVTTDWITDEELLAKPEMVKTMSVKPPMGSGRVRLVRIGDVDLQPCGGTHVSRTSEIGPLIVTKIEKKGRQNRRVRIQLAD